MPSRQSRAVLVALVSTAGMGCAEVAGPQPMNVVPESAPLQVESEHDQVPLTSELQAAGSFRPGTPITLMARVSARSHAAGVSVRLLLPEVAATEIIGNGRAFRSLRDSPVPEHASWTFDAAPAASRNFVTTVVIPHPGYYRATLVAEVASHGSPRGTPQEVTVAQKWLWITPEGGRVTDLFDEALFQDGYIARPGPLTAAGSALSAVPAERGYQSFGTGALAEGASTCYLPNQLPCFAPFRVEFTEPVAAVSKPIADASVTVSYYAQDQQSGSSYLVAEDPQVTDAHGYYTLDCSLTEYYGSDVVWKVVARTYNSAVTVHDGGSNYVASTELNLGRVYNACIESAYGNDGFGDVNMAQDHAAQVYVNMRQAIMNSRSFFQRSRGHITVRAYTTTGISNYGPAPWYDDIQIYSQSIWGLYGQYIAAHEYGHALWEKGLGGDPTPGCSHRIDQVLSMGCAFGEGFATYHGTVTGVDYFNIESTDYSLGCVSYHSSGACATYAATRDGSVVEGAVAATLFDLTDPANEPSDALNFPGWYVADMLNYCRITDSDTGAIRRLSAIDMLIYCAERGVDSAIQAAYFPTRGPTPALTLYQAPSQVPNGWNNLSAIRASWLWNLYRQ